MDQRQWPEVEIFTAPGCADCEQAKAFLREHGIPYREWSVAEEPARAELVKRSGRAAVPTLYIDGHEYVGFVRNRTHIIRALGVDPANVPGAGAAARAGGQ